MARVAWFLERKLGCQVSFLFFSVSFFFLLSADSELCLASWFVATNDKLAMCLFDSSWFPPVTGGLLRSCAGMGLHRANVIPKRRSLACETMFTIIVGCKFVRSHGIQYHALRALTDPGSSPAKPSIRVIALYWKCMSGGPAIPELSHRLQLRVLGIGVSSILSPLLLDSQGTRGFRASGRLGKVDCPFWTNVDGASFQDFEDLVMKAFGTPLILL